MLTIYHNPRCGKSREGLQLLEELNQEFTIIKYLDTPPGADELTEIVKKLAIKPMELVRTKEPIWKEKFADKTLTPKQVIAAMSKYPQLIERPIVINGDKAVIARPAGKVKEIL